MRKEGDSMAPSVQITIVICLTILLLAIIGNMKKR